MNTIDQISGKIDGFLKPIFENKIGAGVISLVIVLYAGLAAPKLPKAVSNLFKSTIFKAIILIFIAYTASKNAAVSIITAVAFLISLQTLSKHTQTDKIINKLEDDNKTVEVTSESEVSVENNEEPVSEPVLEPETIISENIAETDEFIETESIDDFAKFKPSTKDGKYNASGKFEEIISEEVLIETEEPVQNSLLLEKVLQGISDENEDSIVDNEVSIDESDFEQIQQTIDEVSLEQDHSDQDHSNDDHDNDHDHDHSEELVASPEEEVSVVETPVEDKPKDVPEKKYNVVGYSDNFDMYSNDYNYSEVETDYKEEEPEKHEKSDYEFNVTGFEGETYASV